MKKYTTPELKMMCIQFRDVITLSVVDNGSMQSFDFSDLIKPPIE